MSRRDQSRPYALWDPGPIPTEPEMREPRPPRPIGETFAEHQEHIRLVYLLGDHRRAPVWPFLVLVFAIAFLASVLTLALIAATSAVTERRTLPVPSGVAAMRASSVELLEFTAPTDEPRISDEEVMPVPAKKNVVPGVAAVEAIIRNAAVEFGQDPEAMIAVARCESSLRSDAVGDGGAAVGLFQFHRATFTTNARRLFGHEVDEHQRLDPVTSSLVAAWMWSIGQRGQWTCAR